MRSILSEERNGTSRDYYQKTFIGLSLVLKPSLKTPDRLDAARSPAQREINGFELETIELSMRLMKR